MAIQADPTTLATEVEDILITDTLQGRPARTPNGRTSEVFVALADVMANEPERLPQALCDMALELCNAGTSGISIIRRKEDGEEYFYWEALSGVLANFVGGTTPRHFSPCGTSVDRMATQLFSYPSRLFSYLEDVSPSVVEVLVVPFFAAGKPLGAIWIVSHDDHEFDAGQARTMEDIGKFCGAAFSLLAAKADAAAGRAVETQRADKLAEGNAVKDDFIGLVAHELRSPTATIFGNARLLLDRRDKLDQEDVSQALEDISQASTRLNRALENLLVLARPERGGTANEPVDIARICQPVINEHKRFFPTRRIELEQDGKRVLAYGYADSVEQVMWNLISNAEKYSPPSEVIRILLQSIDGNVQVTVKDHGFGIPIEEAEHIFKMFYRAPGANAKASGMGIGLAVCKRLIEAQGGRIWVQPGEAGGTEFCFTLRASGVLE